MFQKTGVTQRLSDIARISHEGPKVKEETIQSDNEVVFKVPLAPTGSRTKTKKGQEISSKTLTLPIEDSLVDDNCSSLSGSLLGNLRDEDESLTTYDSNVSAARHRRRQQHHHGE